MSERMHIIDIPCALECACVHMWVKMLVALRVHEHIAHVFTCTVCHSNSSFSNTRKSKPRNLPLWHVVFANAYMRCVRCKVWVH